MVKVVCRHEPPVLTSDVLILQKEPDVVTVCKPASIPVSRIMTYLPSGYEEHFSHLTQPDYGVLWSLM